MPPLSRRRFLHAAALSVPAILISCNGGDRQQTGTAGRARGAAPGTGAAGTGGATTLAPTPSCGDGPTASQTEGPFFTPSSPEKTSFLADVEKGTKMVLSGSVLATSCQPVDRALVDVWHADDDGAYDGEGYRLRGHLFTDAAGRYRLETIVPGRYPGRTRHLHVKVQRPGGRVLTTQLYLPREPGNERDVIYRPELTMDVRDVPDGKEAAFTFVVA